MFFFFICGEHTFRNDVPGYEGIVCQCHNCGNMAGHVIKSHSWFTLCFVPIIPFSIHGYKDVACTICNFHQPLENRPDVMAMANGGAGAGAGPQQQQQQQAPYPPPPQQQQPPPHPPPQYNG
ncbi:hypothetical protein CDD82_4674 [Ophiocordyceps australis]|uniref:Rhodopsin family protein n=1 Tax=Ophiocordyceps australis TaxID=1399860 RepID=A0A2C5ZV04_9HYPO|nr:hypothetical protein CDD82_4674 [Ophiocordyceps australis]